MQILTKKNRDGDTALTLAAYNGHKEIVRILEEAQKKKEQGDLRLKLIEAATNGKLDQVKDLIAKSADVNAKNQYGSTALIFAARNGYTEIAKALVDKGADINIVNNENKTASQWAQKKGHTEIVQILEKAETTQEKKDILDILHDSTPSAPPYPDIEAQPSPTAFEEFWKPLPPEAPYISESQIPKEESIIASPRINKNEEELRKNDTVEEKDTELRRKTNLHSPRSPKIVLPEDKTQTTNMPAASLTPPAASRQQIDAPAAGLVRPAAEGKHAKRVRKQTSTPPSPKR